MRQLRDNEIVIALIAGQIEAERISSGENDPWIGNIVQRAHEIVFEVIRRGDEAETQP